MQTVSYDFYTDYMRIDKNFNNKMTQRIEDIKNKYQLKLSNQEIIRDYFVELFSWTVIPYHLLMQLYDILKDKCDTILDPCCGNSFHTYLFQTFTPLKCEQYDIQNENNSWTNITEIDGRKVLEKIPNQEKLCLFLSWIDNETISIPILNSFKGNIIISVGNYEGTSDTYLTKLRDGYRIIYQILLKMPWNLTEKLEIYVKK